jgi:hypothetical protein
VPAPQSSDIIAQGEVFVPDHTKESNHAECANWTPPNESQEEQAEPVPAVVAEPQPAEQPPETEAAPTPQNPEGSSADHEQLSPVPIPEILIQGPPSPEPEMAGFLSLGTQAIKNATAATPVGSPPAAVPGADAVPLAVPVEVPAVPAVDVPGAPLPVGGGKGGKRKKIIQKLRKGILRKKLLAVLLGKEIANTVHPLINSAGGAAGGAAPV